MVTPAVTMHLQMMTCRPRGFRGVGEKERKSTELGIVRDIFSLVNVVTRNKNVAGTTRTAP